MAAQHIQIMRTCAFRRSDGTAAHFGATCWYGSPELPIPATVGSQKGASDDFYIVSMDDDVEHWLRLVSEDLTTMHPDPALRPHGNPDGLRHAGGTPHPDYAHLCRGGSFSWDHDPHPLVQQQHAALAALHPLHLIQMFHGPLHGGFVA